MGQGAGKSAGWNGADDAFAGKQPDNKCHGGAAGYNIGGADVIEKLMVWACGGVVGVLVGYPVVFFTRF